MKCDDCISKYRCKLSYRNTYNAQYRCRTYKKIKIRDRKPFNTKKYARNPRERGYMLLKRSFDGIIYALADTSTVSVGWQKTHGILWHDYISAEFYLYECKKWKDYDPHDEVFIVRVNTKRCPVEVDFKNPSPRVNKGNVLFKLKDNVEKYYKHITTPA